MIKKIKNYFFKRKKSSNYYSQCGEDIILTLLFRILKIDMPSYLDIGAYDPFIFSNTALMYKRGCRGINIEPDPVQFKKIAKVRKNDINLNIGISNKIGHLDFYKMKTPTLNTFSKSEAKQVEQLKGIKIVSIEKIEVSTVENVLKDYNNDEFPDLLSIDAEGIILDILKSIDFAKSSPKVICAETVSFIDRTKDQDIIDFLLEKNYMIYADTFINTIFVKKDIWNNI